MLYRTAAVSLSVEIHTAFAIDLFTARILSAHIFVHVSSHVRYTGFHERQQLVRGHSHCAEVVVVHFVFVSFA